MERYKFDTNRKNAKFCPCGKDNKNGKFVPFKEFENFGYCHSCTTSFLPSNETIIKPYEAFVKPKPSFHDYELVKQSGRGFKQNNFVQFLKTLFTEVEVKNAILKYLIGTSKFWKGATIFWQIDKHQRVRHGKVMLYNAEAGNRKKNQDGKAFITSVRSILKLKNFNLNQCLFGLHLINESNQKTIALIESEKSAIIMSIFKPEYIWVATGMKGGFKFETLEPIKDYKIIAFPDKSEFKDWEDKAIELNQLGFKIIVNDWLENSNYEKGTDLADVYIDEVKNGVANQRDVLKDYTSVEKTVHRLEQLTPEIRTLIETFDLTDSYGNKIRKIT